MKRQPNNQCLTRFSLLVDEMPKFDPLNDYYQLYWRAFIQNQLLLQQLKYKSEQREKQLLQITEMSSKLPQKSSEVILGEEKEKRKKHVRRTAKEITKSDKCPYQNCGKYYGSEGSLNLHIKLKHCGGNKTDREKLAKALVLAFASGKELPKVVINLPPRTLEEENRKCGNNLTPEQLIELQKYVDTKFKANLK